MGTPPAKRWLAVSSLVLVWRSNGGGSALLGWALENGHVVLTHDLDFRTALALTHACGPSVVQIRSQHLLPERAGPPAIAALGRFQPELIAGALLVIEPDRSRVRFLPL